MYQEHSEVKLVDHMGSDLSIIRAAQVSVKGGNEPTERKAGLINYLMREKHGTPFEAGVMTFYIKTQIFTSRQIVRHRMCLTGDVEVYFESSAKNGHWKRLDKHYQEFNYGVKDTLGRVRKLRSVKEAQVRSFDENTLKMTRSKVLDVVKSGVKEVFEVTTSKGRSFKASAEHKIFTPAGWRRLRELSPGDDVYGQGRDFRHTNPETRAVPNSLRVAICGWSRGELSVLVKRDGAKCNQCGKEYEKAEELRVDHVVPVGLDLAKSLDVNNLQLLCIVCDRKKTTFEQSLRDSTRMKPVSDLVPDAVVSIVSKGEQETYDLVLEGPDHNFLANGIVVHNSSINEVSGRYKELEPLFYIPPVDRPLVNEGSGAHPELVPGTWQQTIHVNRVLENTYADCWNAYKDLLEQGVATEIARAVLPVGMFTELYMTFNLRSLMNFLSLRVQSPISKPQWEIEEVARMMEEAFQEKFPTVHDAFIKNGRVAP